MGFGGRTVSVIEREWDGHLVAGTKWLSLTTAETTITVDASELQDLHQTLNVRGPKGKHCPKDESLATPAGVLGRHALPKK